MAAQVPEAGVTSNSGESGSDQTEVLTPALIREVTDKVYRLMQRDLDVAQQRTRTHYRRKRGTKGNIR